MLTELRQRLLALGYEFVMPEEISSDDDETPEASENIAVETIVGNLLEEENNTEESPAEESTIAEDGPEEPETPALRLALGRALAFMRRFCNKLTWPEDSVGSEETDNPENSGSPDNLDYTEILPLDCSWELREVALDLAAAYFLQAKMALAPDSLAVLPTLTSLRMGDAAWGFAGGTQKSGTDALTRTEALAVNLLREAMAALCAWRSL